MKPSIVVLALATVVLTAGCFTPQLSRGEKDRLEAQTADDIGEQLEEFDSFSAGLTDIDSARGTWEECFAAYGGCERCYLLDGTAQAGTLSMELVTPAEVTSCTQALTLNDTRYEYTIEDRQWAGSWTLLSGTPGDDALWDVEWSGNQDANLVITGSENADGTYDSSFTMNSASGITDGDGNVSEWAVDYEYTGFLDRNWQVTAAMDASGVIAGAVLGSGGTSCVVSGSQYDVVVDCE